MDPINGGFSLQAPKTREQSITKGTRPLKTGFLMDAVIPGEFPLHKDEGPL
jgi:hypothetical protein